MNVLCSHRHISTGVRARYAQGNAHQQQHRPPQPTARGKPRPNPRRSALTLHRAGRHRPAPSCACSPREPLLSASEHRLLPARKVLPETRAADSACSRGAFRDGPGWCPLAPGTPLFIQLLQETTRFVRASRPHRGGLVPQLRRRQLPGAGRNARFLDPSP